MAGNRWLVALLVPLFVLGALPGGAQTSDAEPWVLTDPAGDMHHVLVPAVPMPPTKLSETADLVRVELRDENATTLTLAWRVADLDELMVATQQVCTGLFVAFACYRVQYEFEFRLNDDEDRWYAVYASAFYVPGLMAQPQLGASINELESRGNRFNFREYRFVQGHVDMQADELALPIPKDMLHVGWSAEERGVARGDRLTGLEIQGRWYLYAGAGLPVAHFVDDVPNDGDAPPYTFRAIGAGSEVRLETAEDRVPRGEDEFFFQAPPPVAYATAPGTVVPIPLYVTNGGATKRILNLATSVDAERAGWNASLVPQLIVNANETAVTTVLAHAPAAAAHREAAAVTVRASALDDPDTAAEKELRVVAARTPTPQEPTIHLHSNRVSWGGPAGPAMDGAFPLYVVAANTVRSDEGYEDVPVDLLLRGFYTFPLDTPLATPLMLDPAGAATLTLRFTSPLAVPQTARVTATLYRTGTSDEVVAGGQADVTLEPGATELTLPMPVDAPGPHTGGGLVLQVYVRAVGRSTPLGGLPLHGTLDVAASSLLLPAIPAPRAALGTATEGVRLSLGLNDDRDRVEYVNPGEARRFNLTARSEDAAPLAVQWRVEASDAAWRIRTEGAPRATLEPGNATHLTVYAWAPADAAEASALALNVTALARPAADRKADPVPTSTTLRVIVTQGIDLDDDAPTGPAPSPSGKSGKKLPGPDALAALAAVGAAVALARRRR